MSKRNAALEALMAGQGAPQVVEGPSPGPAPSASVVTLVRRTVANSAARSMLYLPPKAKRKFKEIAFIEGRKEHDVYVEALREYLERRGHGGLL